MTALYSAEDYAGALRKLMPRGRVWPEEPDSVQAKVLLGLSQIPERLDGAAVKLVADIFPATTVDLLPEWEETLSLPDPCLGPNPTIQQRQDQVRARFIGSGGQSARWFIDYAAALGFFIKITVYAPFRAGRSRAGMTLGGPEWAFAWLVTILSDASSVSHAAFRAGQAGAGDPLSSASASYATLECELRKLAPAHTILNFILP